MNLFTSIVPFEETAVFVKEYPDQNKEDIILEPKCRPEKVPKRVIDSVNYIDASYIKSAYQEDTNGFIIAAAGVLSETIVNFWRMIYQNNVTRIVTLTQNLHTECRNKTNYFPIKEGQSFHVDTDLKVKMIRERALSIGHGFEARREYKLTFKHNGKKDEKRITHTHFLNWKNESVPSSDSMKAYNNMIKNTVTFIKE